MKDKVDAASSLILLLSAADEMDDLNLVAVAHERFTPFRAANDVVVQFYGNKPLPETKSLEQFAETRFALDLAQFAVEMDLDHISIVMNQL
jgi:hypothetical protein